MIWTELETTRKVYVSAAQFPAMEIVGSEPAGRSSHSTFFQLQRPSFHVCNFLLPWNGYNNIRLVVKGVILIFCASKNQISPRKPKNNYKIVNIHQCT